MVSSRKADPSAKKISKLYVEPSELARKLIKELEDSKITRAGQVWARNEYTVFLCREDFGRFRGHVDQLVGKLESHLEKHVRGRRYATSGDITVELTLDPDLKPGFFGVLAERGTSPAVRPGGGAPAGRSVWDVPEDSEDDEYVNEPPRGAGAYSAPSLPRTPSLGGPAMGAPVPMPSLPSVPPLPAGAPALGPSYARSFSAPPAAELSSFAPPPLARPAPQPQAAPPSLPLPGGAGRVDASQTNLASETIVLKVNGQAREFSQGRVVIGRSRDVDLQIDHADVSRRHAMIYLSEGSIVVKDLGSTNGTMVNGYPVESTVVRPTDAIRIGNCNITAASR